MNGQTVGLALITILLWGTIPVVDKLALTHYAASPLVGIAIRAGSVAILAIPLALTVGRADHATGTMPTSAIALYVASGVISLLLAQYTYYRLLAQTEVSHVFPLLFAAAPLVTIGLGVAFLGESMSLKQALGAALVILGSLLLI